MLKGTNNDGIWSEDEKRLSIIVLPPWWKTWWARLTFVGSILLIGITAFRIRLSVIKRQKKVLEKEVALRTEEVLDQKKEIENQAVLLKEANDQKNKLFSIISHDLRSPLSSLKGIIHMLDPKILNKDDLEEIRNEISARINGLSDVMINLLDWAKGQMEGATFYPEHFDLAGLCNEMIQLYEVAAKEKGVTLRNKVKSGSMVFADLNQVRVILRNLIENALKFTDRDDAIEISSSKDEDAKMTIMVRDTGLGMSKNKVESLFSFQTKPVPGTGGEKGVGLGLLLVKEFVEKNGGSVWLESEPGKGSAFFFTLPILQDEAKK